MKIGIDVTPLQNGHQFRGIGNYTRGLLYGLSVLDTDDQFMLYYWKGLPLFVDEMEFPKNSTWIGIPYPRAGRFSALISQQLFMLPSLFIQMLDVYHQLGIVADPAAGGIPWAYANRSVITVHDLTPLVYSDRFLKGKRTRQLIYRLMLSAVRHARHVIADSMATRSDLEHLLGVRRHDITVTPLAVSPALASALESSQKDGNELRLPENYILTVAGDYPNKGLGTLLNAYKEMADTVEIPELVIIGPSGSTIDSFLQRNPDIAPHLHLRQRISDSALATAYKGALMVIVPSEYEGFGLPILEAMAAGAPVIATTATSLPEVAGDAAILVPPGDAFALAQAITWLAGQPAVRSSLRRKGLDRVSYFTWERTAKMTYEVYCKVARTRVEHCDLATAKELSDRPQSGQIRPTILGDSRR